MPEEVHELAEKLKGHKEVHNPWALANAIVARRKKAQAARVAHRREKEEKGEE